MDDLRTALAELAPEIEVAPALAAFRVRRRRDRRLRRAGAVVALAAVLIGLAAIVAGALGDDRRSTVIAGHGEESTPQPTLLLPDRDFHGIADIMGGPSPIGSLRSVASNDDDYPFRREIGLATEIEARGDPIVLSITVADDDCPKRLTAFEQSGDVLTPVFVDEDTGCGNEPGPYTFVVSLTPPASLRPTFTLRLRADPPSHGERRLTVSVPGSAAEEERCGPTTTQVGGTARSVCPSDDVPVAGPTGTVGHIHSTNYNNSTADPPYAVVFDDQDREVGVFGPNGFVPLDEARRLGLLEGATR